MQQHNINYVFIKTAPFTLTHDYLDKSNIILAIEVIYTFKKVSSENCK